MQSSPNEVKETKTLPDIFWTSKRVLEMSDKWVLELTPEEGFKTILEEKLAKATANLSAKYCQLYEALSHQDLAIGALAEQNQHLKKGYDELSQIHSQWKTNYWIISKKQSEHIKDVNKKFNQITNEINLLKKQ